MSIHFSLFLIVACLVQGFFALTVGNIQNARIHAYKRDVLQDVVSWDEHSILVRGERIMIYSGEVHPFRLPSPGLWLDVFQKIKAMGFSGVSFYTYWGLLEGSPGEMVMNGVFSLDEFFNAATEAGIYLIARPGPYINAETAAGGIPGWVLKIKGVIRSTGQDYLDSTQNYASTIGKIIARAQITNGGPVIMVQPENEYASWPGVTNFPSQMNKEYMAFVEQQLLDAGIVVPFIVNDNLNIGNFAPGSGLAEVDLYGIDAYPMRYDCGDPYIWPTYRFPKTWEMSHANYSPSTPLQLPNSRVGVETGGKGGVGEDRCAILTNNDAIKVQFKNTYSFAVAIFNVYMIYGGTNWGNLGYHGGYTSYDYGASITEDRQIWREKYSEMKLEANFLKASAAYLTTTPGHGANGSYGVPAEIAVTPLFGAINDTNGTRTNFYVVRHADFTSFARTLYNFTVTTSRGNITISQLGGSLVMNGRDSKIHVTDYDIGGLHMIYSSAEIFSWAKSIDSGRVLVLYGGNGENNEAAFPASFGVPEVIEGHGVDIQRLSGSWVLHWMVEPERRVVQIGKLRIYLLWRNEAYNYWSLEIEAPQPVGNHTSPSKSFVIINGGYLLRTAGIEGKLLKLTGDINATANFEVISTPTEVTSLFFNGKLLHTKSRNGNLLGQVSFSPPSITLPNFKTQPWHYIDSLPELQPTYNDSQWTSLDHTTTNNTLNLTTPTSMYASDYGYHTGSLIYRGHFLSTGNEATFFINTTGGAGFAHSIWLNSTFLGSWIGSGGNQTYAQTLALPSSLQAGNEYVFTVLIDHMGQDEEAPGTDAIKFPRGILNYSLSSHPQTDIVWKMTGNLGGERYIDKTRGPRNEGAMFAERHGYHLPNPPSEEWGVKNPVEDGVESAGVGFFTTKFELHVTEGWDVPMGFVFNGTSGEEGNGGNYRVQLFVNGWQFGKYVNNLGPQTNFPIPEGILNHHGTNTVALTLWSLDSEGAKIGGFELVPNATIWSGYRKPALVDGETWSERVRAY